jgi:hypothetical protein
MLDTVHLASVEHQLALSSTGSLTDRCMRIARAVHIVSPIVGNFNAETITLVPMVKVLNGVPDCFSAASALMVFGSAEEEDGNILVRNLRSYPEEFERAVGVLREIVQMSVGLRTQAPQPVLPASNIALKALQFAIYEGALGFVVFHELAHLLLPAAEDEHQQEHNCDAFAAYLLIASRDPRSICGVYAAQMLSYAMAAEEEGWQSLLKQPKSSQRPRTHPRSASRFHRVATFVERHGLMPTGPFDALLAVPTRLMEEEIFEHSTRYDVYDRLSQYLSGLSEPDLDDELQDSIAGGISWAVRLPKLSESTEVTLQPADNGMRARIVTLELPNAVLAANVMIKQRLLKDPGISADEKDEAMRRGLKRAVAIVLGCLAALAKKTKPPDDAALVFHSLITAPGHERTVADLEQELGSRMIVKGGLTALENLGCTLLKKRCVRALDHVNIRLVHKPRYD